MAALRDAFRRHRRVVSVAPTGSGKTREAAFIVASAAAKGRRTIFTVHRAELLDQASAALADAGVAHGLIRPGQRCRGEAVAVAMVQTLLRRDVPEPDFMVVDEGHHAVSPSWRALLARWPSAKVLYLTATPARLDGQGMVAVADALVPGPSVAGLIAEGWLAPFRYFAPPAQAELAGVRRRAGDFEREGLAEAMDRPAITGDAVEHYRRLAAGKRALAFCISRQHAEHVAEAFSAAGFRAVTLHGGLAEAERRARDAAFRDGRLDLLAVVDLVSEGYDVPGVEVVIHLRPTASLALCRQINGRGLRPKPDGAPCLILDHVGNVGRHGLPDEEIAWTLDGRAKRASEVAPAVRQCPECWCCHPPASACPECGHVYPRQVRREAPAERAGHLAEITGREVERYRAAKLRDLVRSARSFAELRAIGRARGYHPGSAKKAAQIWRKPFATGRLA